MAIGLCALDRKRVRVVWARMIPAQRTFAPLDFLQLIAIAVIWGVNNLFAKLTVDALPAMMTVALRFGLVLATLFVWLKPPPKGKYGLFFATILCVGPLHFGVLYTGLKLAHALSPMVVVMQLWAPASVVFAALLLKESVSPQRWVGVGLAFLGAASMNFDPAVLAEGWALVWVAAASTIYGLGAVLVRRLGVGLDPWASQAWIALATAPLLALCSLLFETGQVEAARDAHWIVWFFLAFGAIGSSIVANAFMFRLVQRYEVSRTTPYLLLTPVITFALAGLVMGDRITPQIAVGAAATMGGVALVALAERRFKALA